MLEGRAPGHSAPWTLEAARPDVVGQWETLGEDEVPLPSGPSVSCCQGRGSRPRGLAQHACDAAVCQCGSVTQKLTSTHAQKEKRLPEVVQKVAPYHRLHSRGALLRPGDCVPVAPVCRLPARW